MKHCAYCCQSIEDTARKCPFCQSYQDSKDIPGPRTDVAALVISFIGMITIVATVVGGTFAYFGFTTVKDINDRYEKLSQKNNELVESARKTAEKLSLDQAKFDADQKNLLAAVESSRNQLNILLVQELAARFRRIMDDATLDELEKTTDLVKDIRSFPKILADISPIPAASEPVARNIKLLVDGVSHYMEARYEECIAALKGVTDDDLNKHRILAAAYGKLHDRAKANKNRNDEVRYGALLRSAAQSYFNIVKYSSRSATIASVYLAGALVSRNEPGDLDKAMEYLNEAKKREPQKSLIYYNMAIIFAMKHALGPALDNLEQAKTYGDFSTEADINFFNDDPSFAELRASDVASHQERLSRLRSINR